MGNEFEKNHFFPNYNLQYWKKINSKLYDKKIKKDRNFNPANNFCLHKFYYFDGTPQIEKRLGKIENYMSQILKKISNSVDSNNIELSEYEIIFIQLFLSLQASRQLNTTEVIKTDEAGIYQSNNFLLGTHNLKSKEQMVKNMYTLINALESFIKKKSSKDLEMWMGMQMNHTHLVIAKNNNNQICQSDVCCIIENDIDSNHMYTYFPQTPNIAFFLVKSKYFYRDWHRLNYLKRSNDTEISPILQNLEIELICQYNKEGFSEQSSWYSFSTKPINSFTQWRKNKIKLNFFNLPNDIVNHYNKILFDDGQIFVHSQEANYISYLKAKSDNYRKLIILNPEIYFAGSHPLIVQQQKADSNLSNLDQQYKTENSQPQASTSGLTKEEINKIQKLQINKSNNNQKMNQNHEELELQ